MTQASDVRHVDDVLRSVSGNTRATAEQEITTSWSRCAKDYRLDPARPYTPTVLSASELRERRAQNEELVTIATAWPGNVRELRNVIRTALALSEGGVVRVEDLPSEIRERTATIALDLQPRPPASAAEKPQNALGKAEKAVLLQVIQDNHWNMTLVARQLGMSRTTLYRKIRQHGIQLPSAAAPGVTNS